MVKRVPCDICGKMLLGKQFVKRHREVVHKELLNDEQYRQKLSQTIFHILPKK